MSELDPYREEALKLRALLREAVSDVSVSRFPGAVWLRDAAQLLGIDLTPFQIADAMYHRPVGDPLADLVTERAFARDALERELSLLVRLEQLTELGKGKGFTLGAEFRFPELYKAAQACRAKCEKLARAFVAADEQLGTYPEER